MTPKAKQELVRRLRQQRVWLIAQAEKYESGRPELGTENGIVAAQRCSGMAAKYRQRAETLDLLIAAHDQEARD